MRSALFIGKFRVYGLRDGYFHLDGGAMFGVVPKVIWQKKFPPDDKNNIKLGLNCFLVQAGKTRILLETGIGTLLNPKYREHYVVEQEPGLIGALQSQRVKAEDIDIVINSHLHFDHCGGNTNRDAKREILPSFPNAQYVIQRGEWDCALDPFYRDKPSYMEESFRPLQERGQVNLVDGDTEILPGLEVLIAPGHTEFHQCVKLKSEGEVLVFLGDLVPTSGHVGLSYIMSYDLYPVETLANKQRFFEQAIAEDWTVAFGHDPNLFFGKIALEKEKYVFQSLKS